MERKWIRRTAWLMLSRVPWLRRRAQRALWQIRARQPYKQRKQDIQRLLDRYAIKCQRIRGPKHIILIVVDCWRKGNLSLYGYYRETTAFLESVADRAAVFESALSASPWTYPSVATMLTGLYPHHHGGMHPNDPRNFDKEVPSRVDKNILSLPELLVALGFDSNLSSAITTAALPCIGWFKASRVVLSDVDDQLKEVLIWLKKNREKNTFLYLQLADLHPPLNPPEQYRDSFGKIADIPKLDVWEFRKDAMPRESDFELYRENREKLYDCTIRYVDVKLATFIKCLEEEGILDSSLVIITSDHGEEFWDHVETERKLFYDPRGFFGVGHGHNLFQEIINVPLMCIGPGVTAGCYNQNVSLVDLAPTVLDICGIEHELALDGRNLFECSDERVLISEGIAYGYEKKAVVHKNWKLIHSEGDGVSLLFDLYQDPKEKRDLAKINPEKVQELKGHLPRAEVKGETLKIDRDIKEQLRDLGYM